MLTSPSTRSLIIPTEYRDSEGLMKTQTALLGLGGEEAESTSTLPTETQADSSPDGVSIGVRVEPALHGLAQHVSQGDLRAIGHLQGLALSDSSQPTLRRVRTG